MDRYGYNPNLLARGRLSNLGAHLPIVNVKAYVGRKHSISYCFVDYLGNSDVGGEIPALLCYLQLRSLESFVQHITQHNMRHRCSGSFSWHERDSPRLSLWGFSIVYSHSVQHRNFISTYTWKYMWNSLQAAFLDTLLSSQATCIVGKLTHWRWGGRPGTGQWNVVGSLLEGLGRCTVRLGSIQTGYRLMNPA